MKQWLTKWPVDLTALHQTGQTEKLAVAERAVDVHLELFSSLSFLVLRGQVLQVVGLLRCLEVTKVALKQVKKYLGAQQPNDLSR